MRVLGRGAARLRRTGTGARAAAALVLLAVPAAGCSPDAEPSPMPTPSPTSSSAAAEPSTTLPTMPAEAMGTSAAAAKAFARYYVETINFGLEFGDTTPLRDSSAPGCETCDAIADKIDESHAGPAYLEGASWRPRGFEYIRVGADEALIAVPIRIAPARAYAREGATPVETEATRGNLDLRLSRASGRWLVLQLDASQ